MYGESYVYTNSSSLDPATATAIMVGTLVLAVIIYVINAIFLGMIFKKAGIESWKAWVPVYNAWLFLELGKQPGWISLLVLTFFIPVIGLITSIVAAVFTIIAAYRIGLNFGKEGIFVLLYVFLPIVWLIWLAVDKTAVWKGSPAAAVEADPAKPQSETSEDVPPSAPNNNPPSPNQPPSM